MLSKLIATAILKAKLVEFLGLPAKTKESKEQLVTQLLLLIEADSREKAQETAKGGAYRAGWYLSLWETSLC